MSSHTFNSSSVFCSLSEKFEYFGRFSFLISASISLFAASINVMVVPKLVVTMVVTKWLINFYLMVVFWRNPRLTGWFFEYSVFSEMLMACGVFKMFFEFYVSAKTIYLFIKCFFGQKLFESKQNLSFYLKVCIRLL